MPGQIWPRACSNFVASLEPQPQQSLYTAVCSHPEGTTSCSQPCRCGCSCGLPLTISASVVNHVPGHVSDVIDAFPSRTSSANSKNTIKCPHSECARSKKRFQGKNDAIKHLKEIHQLEGKDATLWLNLSLASSDLSLNSTSASSPRLVLEPKTGRKNKRNQKDTLIQRRSTRSLPTLDRADEEKMIAKKAKHIQHREVLKVSNITRPVQHMVGAENTVVVKLSNVGEVEPRQDNGPLLGLIQPNSQSTTFDSQAQHTRASPGLESEKHGIRKRERKAARKAKKEMKRKKSHGKAAEADLSTAQMVKPVEDSVLIQEDNRLAEHYQRGTEDDRANTDNWAEMELGQWTTIMERMQQHPEYETEEIDITAENGAKALCMTVEEFWEASAMAWAMEEEANDRVYWEAVDMTLAVPDQFARSLPRRSEATIASNDGQRYRQLVENQDEARACEMESTGTRGIRQQQSQQRTPSGREKNERWKRSRK